MAPATTPNDSRNGGGAAQPSTTNTSTIPNIIDIETVHEIEQLATKHNVKLVSSNRHHGRFHGGGNQYANATLNEVGEPINMNGQRIDNRKRHYLKIVLVSTALILILLMGALTRFKAFKQGGGDVIDMDEVNTEDDDDWKACFIDKTSSSNNVITDGDNNPDLVYRIVEICDVPDLDDDIFNSDVTMDIKLLVNDEIYWPQNTRDDCSPIYGSYDGSCVIPDTSLMGVCYQISNPIELPLHVPTTVVAEEEQEQEPSTHNKNIKVTIYDEDIFTDDYIDIFVPQNELWKSYYREYGCDDSDETDSILPPALIVEYQAPKRAAYIKISVEKPQPKVCGYEIETIQEGLIQASNEFENLSSALDSYVTPYYEDDVVTVSGGNTRRLSQHYHRKLLFPALFAGASAIVTGVKSFAGIFARGAKSQGPLSTLADLTTIGGTLYSNLAGGGSSQQQQIDYTKQFDQIFEQLDQIDNKLNGIQTQLQSGFQTLQLTIQEELAQQELDDWITSGSSHLSTLQSDYNAYRNPDFISDNQKNVYENIFRSSCQQFHKPMSIVQFVYSHTCDDCKLYSSSNGSDSSINKSQQYILDTYINLARNLDVSKLPNSNSSIDLTDDEKRILWFRQTFGTIIIAAMTQSIYLHSVCLYDHHEGNDESNSFLLYCPNEDPVWSNRLDEMGQALEEIVTNLVDAEERIIA